MQGGVARNNQVLQRGVDHSPEVALLDAAQGLILELPESLLDITQSLAQAFQDVAVDPEPEERDTSREEGEQELGCQVVDTPSSQGLVWSRQFVALLGALRRHERGDRQLSSITGAVQDSGTLSL